MEIIDNAQHKEYASKSLGNTALGFGIAGTAIALLSGGMGLFGLNRNAGSCNNGCTLTCEDKVELAGAIYQGRITELQERFDDRQVIDREMFGLYKSQVDADFGLYKSTRDSFDVMTAKQNQAFFDLYKGQRDNYDALSARLNNLETQVAVNAAIRPYQDKLIQCEIDKAYTAGINYTDRKTCKMITGQVVLPNTPTVTGFGSYCCCPATAAATAAS